MTASGRRTVIVSMAALGVAFLLAWAAASGSPRLVGDQPSRTAEAPAHLVRTTTQHDTSKKIDDLAILRGSGHGLGRLLSDLGTLALILAGLGILAQAARMALIALAPRVSADELVVDLDPLPDVEAGREAMHRDRERQHDALRGADVRNGIVACWVLLEEAASVAGVVRRPAETATEFVVRFLHALDVDPRAVGELAGLYHEARFSTHAMDEAARAAATSSLRAVHEDLARAGATP